MILLPGKRINEKRRGSKAPPFQFRYGIARRIVLRVNFPGVTGAEKFFEVALALLRDNVGDLAGDHVFVARNVAPVAQHADRSGEAGAVFHVRKHESI